MDWFGWMQPMESFNANGLAPQLGLQQLKGKTLSNAPKFSANLGLNHTGI